MAKERNVSGPLSKGLGFLFTVLIMPACATAEGDPMPQTECVWDSDEARLSYRRSSHSLPRPPQHLVLV